MLFLCLHVIKTNWELLFVRGNFLQSFRPFPNKFLFYLFKINPPCSAFKWHLIMFNFGNLKPFNYFFFRQTNCKHTPQSECCEVSLSSRLHKRIFTSFTTKKTLISTHACPKNSSHPQQQTKNFHQLFFFFVTFSRVSLRRF